MTLAKKTDKKTIEKIQKGDLKTYEKLFRDYYQILCNYSNRFVQDIDEAEEIVQELFYVLWKNRKTLNITVSLNSYLYKSVYNRSLQYLQHKKVERKYETYAKSQTLNYNPDPSEAVRAGELANIIQNTMKSLPDRCRTIFNMSRYEGLKYHEIADKLSISVKTVEANMSKALKMFRVTLKDYAGVLLLLVYWIL